MFGYIKVNNDELKGKHLRLYKEYYCALCTQLKIELGMAYRFLTNYDVTFFLMLFDCLEKEKSEMSIKCPINNKRNKTVYISKNAMEYSILIDLFWTMEKLNDDINDEGKKLLHVINKIMRKNEGIASRYDANELIKKWEDKLQEFYKAEKGNESFDYLSNLIGDVYGIVFEDYCYFAGIEFDKTKIYEFGCLLGKYIYIMDAFDDYFDDVKKSRFNPIMKMYDYDDIKNCINKLCIRVESIISFIVQEINNLFDACFVDNCETFYIVENVVRYGLIDKLIEIKAKKYAVGDEQ